MTVTYTTKFTKEKQFVVPHEIPYIGKQEKDPLTRKRTRFVWELDTNTKD